MNLERERNKGFLEMKQTGLIQHVIEAVGLDDIMVKGGFTPSDQRPLVKDANGKPPSVVCSYTIIVGVLLYLSGNNRPDIASAVN